MIRTLRQVSLVVVTCGLASCGGGGGDDGDRGTGPATGIQFTAVTAAGYYTCGISDTGAAECWGDNFSGQLGTGTTEDSFRPAPVAGGLRFATITASGIRHACGLTATGAAYCWGERGLLGTAQGAGSLVPVAVAGGHTFTVISSGGGHSCGLTSAGEAYCWGNNAFYGALGNGATTGGETPVRVVGGHTFIAISAGGNHTCAIATGGAAYCWGTDGANRERLLGTGNTVSLDDCQGAPCSLVPVPVAGGISFTSITASREHTCGLTAEGVGYCWGTNNSGQLGDGSLSARASPARVAPGMLFAALSAGSGDRGEAQTCGLTSDSRTAVCWGFNSSGQLGIGTTEGMTAPTPVKGRLTYSAISVGRDHVCALTTDRVLYCWGGNSNGSLGTGTSERFVTVPSRVAGQR